MCFVDSTVDVGLEGVDEALEFAKSMAKQEILDNKKNEHRSIFWATIVGVLSQKLNIVRVRRDNG